MTLTELKGLCRKARLYYKSRHSQKQWVRHTAHLYESNRHILQGRTANWKPEARL